jgi:uncharacterized protein (TIGR02996 family)
VRDDSAFLKQLDDDPEDLATLLVYADWLEDNGSVDRAEFLRLQQHLLQLRHRQKGFLPFSRRLLASGTKLDAAWLTVVSRPRLVGTCWSGDETIGDSTTWRFLAGGTLNYTCRSGTHQNATWVQVGTHVTMETNQHYADYEGFIGGDWMRGTAKNVQAKAWRWSARRTTDPELCDPRHLT